MFRKNPSTPQTVPHSLLVDVAAHATTDFSILIWGAPLVLIGYVNLGWLMGRGHVREVLILQIGANSLNIIFDFIFVLIFHLGVAGVAVATLISQGLGFLLGLYLILERMPLALLKAHFEVFSMVGP